MVRNNKMLTSRHEKAPESFDSEALDHDYYIWVKLGAYEKVVNTLSFQESFEFEQGVFRR